MFQYGLAMRYNYTATVGILSVIKGLMVHLGNGPDAHKGIGLAILGLVVFCPIALFFDWRSHVKERRELLSLHAEQAQSQRLP